MKLKTLTLITVLLTLPALVFATPITYPGSSATDSSTGAAVTSGVTAAVASVTDLDGNAKTSTLAVAHVAGGNTSAVYDTAANGEAWVTLTLTASGHTFAPVVIFCSSDPSTLATANTGISAANTGITANGTAITTTGVKVGSFTSAALIAEEQGVFNYILAGTTFGDHVINNSSVLWGGFSVTRPDSTHQGTSYTLNGTTYINSSLVSNSSGQPVSKTVTPANQ